MKLLNLQFWRNHWPKIISIFFFILLSSAYVSTFAVFAPGETLNPNCEPGISGCTVSNASPVTVVNTSSLFSTGISGAGSGVTTTESVFIGTDAGNAATNATGSNFLGRNAGYQATNAWYSNFLGQFAGDHATGAYSSNFIGRQTGSNASNAYNSNFIGYQSGSSAAGANNSNFFGGSAGFSATSASNSNFFGSGAGSSATNASFSNFFGSSSGSGASSASYSNLLGFQAGMFYTGNNIGSNNIIIGTNISLPDTIANSMNLGGVIFAKNTYATTTGNPSVAATATGSVGIGVVSPTARLMLPAGTNTAGTAPLKLTAGTALGTTEAGAMEFDGTHLYFTIANAGARYQLDQQGGGLTVGTTAIASGTSTRVLYDNAGVLGEMTTTGSGTTLALATTPTFVTNITTPLVLGGSTTTSPLTFQTTSAVGATGADMHFKVGNAGGTEAMTILNNGNVGINTISPASQFEIKGFNTDAVLDVERVTNGTFDTDLSSWSAPTWTAGSAKANYTGTAGPITNAIEGISMNTGGIGYTNGDVLTLQNGANNATITITSVDGNGKIDNWGWSMTSYGTANTTNASVSTTGGTGSGAKFSINLLADSIKTLSQNVSVSNGNTYQVMYTVTLSSGQLGLTLGYVSGHNIKTGGTYTQVITAAGAGSLYFTPTVDFTGSIDNISVKQIFPSASTASLLNSNGTYGLEFRSGGVGRNNTFVGYRTGYSNITGMYNTASGSKSLFSNTTGGANVSNGYSSLYSNTTGSSNVASGNNSLYFNTTGSSNVANGNQSLFSNTTGNYNTANGYYSLFSNTTGNYNTVNGSNSLFSNTTGGDNVANGFNSLFYNTTGSYNVTNGNNSLFSNTTGNCNTINGDSSLYYNTTGSYNIALGYNAGNLVTTGATTITTSSSSIFVGYDTRASADANTNEIVIGSRAIGNGSNTTTIGTRNVLYIGGSGIGTNSKVARFTNASGYCDVTPVTGGVSCSSDINLKKNILTLEDNKNFILQTIPVLPIQETTLDKIMKITPVNYNWNSEEYVLNSDGTDNKHIGFIAQEMEQIFPNIVSTDAKGTVDPITGKTIYLKSISYASITPYLVKGIQEMNLQVKDLQSLDTTKATSLGSLMKNFLGEVGNNVTDLYASVIHSDKVETKMLCVGSTCVTEQQFLEIVNKNVVIPVTPILQSPSPDLSSGNSGSSASQPPSCTDGIQNQDETSIDTGGVCSSTTIVLPTCISPQVLEGNTCITPTPPTPTCSDGIQNQDETAIDTGGVCTSI